MTFRNRVLVFLSSLYFMNLHAQTTDPQVFGTLGSTIDASGYSMAYQIGETVASTLFHGEGIINQGFIQSELLISTSTSFPVHMSLAIYPNPTVEEIYIRGFGQEGGFWSVYDGIGRLYSSGTFDHHSFSSDYRIPIAHLPPGFYILTARTSSGASFQPAPFIKY